MKNISKRTPLWLTLFAIAPIAVPIYAQDAPKTETAAETSKNETPATPAPTEDEKFSQGVLFPFSLFDLAIKDAIDDRGNVDYAKLKGNPNLDRFVRAVGSADLKQFPVFEIKSAGGDKKDDTPAAVATPKEKKAPELDRSWELAFWLNAFNAIALKTIADAYPINSVSEIENFETAKTHQVAGEMFSLQELRAKIGGMDKRALFALMTGTRSGPRPPLRAFRYLGLNEVLEASVGVFVNNESYVNLQRLQNRVEVNPFFATVDEAWKPSLGKEKWNGIRYLLKAYSSQNANRSYYNTGNYRISFMQGNDALNVVDSGVRG